MLDNENEQDAAAAQQEAQAGLEQRLKESETLLGAIVATAREGILVADAETGRMVMTNPAMCRLTGYSEAELIGMRAAELHTPEVQQRVRQVFHDMAAGRFSPVQELPFLRKDGSLFYADASTSPFSIGGKLRFLGVFRDVTERRQAREAQARREEAFARTEAIARIGSWDWDLATDTLLWSDENYRVLGYPPRSLAPSVEAFKKSVHPEDRQRIEAALKSSLADASVPFNLEHRVLRSNGEIRLVHQVGKVYRDEMGKPVRMIGTAQDITEQKRVERELARYRDDLQALVEERTAKLAAESRRNATIIDLALDGFFTGSLDGRILDCNEAYCRMLGYTREEMLRLSFGELEADENPEELAAHMRKILAQGRDRFDTRHRRKDGGVVPVEVNVAIAQIGAEKMFFSFVNDITARKENEEALILARDEAERAN